MNSWTVFYPLNSSVSCLWVQLSLENPGSTATCQFVVMNLPAEWYSVSALCSPWYGFIQQHLFPPALFHIPYCACSSSQWSGNSNDHQWECGKNWVLLLTMAARIQLRFRCWENSSKEAGELRNSALPYEPGNSLPVGYLPLHFCHHP